MTRHVFQHFQHISFSLQLLANIPHFGITQLSISANYFLQVKLCLSLTHIISSNVHKQCILSGICTSDVNQALKEPSNKHFYLFLHHNNCNNCMEHQMNELCLSLKAATINKQTHLYVCIYEGIYFTFYFLGQLKSGLYPSAYSHITTSFREKKR